MDLDENYVYVCKVGKHCIFNVNSSSVKCVVRTAVHYLQYCCNWRIIVAKQIPDIPPLKKDTSRPIQLCL